jgi:hypothetical protein
LATGIVKWFSREWPRFISQENCPDVFVHQRTIQRVQEPRVLRFCPPETGVSVAKQKHDSGRKKMDQRRSKEKREPGGRRGDRVALGKGGSRGKPATS